MKNVIERAHHLLFSLPFFLFQWRRWEQLTLFLLSLPVDHKYHHKNVVSICKRLQTRYQCVASDCNKSSQVFVFAQSLTWASYGFLQGTKNGKISFYLLETKKTTSFAENMKSSNFTGPLAPLVASGLVDQ